MNSFKILLTIEQRGRGKDVKQIDNDTQENYASMHPGIFASEESIHHSLFNLQI